MNSGKEALPSSRNYGAVIAIAFLVGTLLLPHGVGIRLPLELPKLDLPRLCMLAMVVTAGMYLILHPRRFALFKVAPRTMALLAFIAIWQLVSALTAGKGLWSYYWVFGSIIAFWGFATAFLLLAGHPESRPRVIRALVAVAVLLALWSVLEFVTQEKLVAYRNLYAADPAARYWPRLHRAGEFGDFPFMSFGPYSLHHNLAAVLCALSGFLIMGPIKRAALWYFVGSLLLTVAIFSTQSRTGVVAFAALVMAGLYLQKAWRSRLATACGGVLGLILFVSLFGGVDAFKTVFLHQTDAKSTAVSLFNNAYLAPQRELGEHQAPKYEPGEDVASAQGRLVGLAMFFYQAEKWWLFGQGPGSSFNAERIASDVIPYADIGSFFMFMEESGLPIGFALSIIIAFSLRQGLRSEDWAVRSAALGVGSFWLFSMAGVGLYGWTVLLVLAGLIEAWSRQTNLQHAIQSSAG